MFGIGLSFLEDSYEAGKKAAANALKMAKGTPKFALILASPKKHIDPTNLLGGIKEVLGSIPVFGSSTAGEITTEGPVQGSVVVFVSSSPDICIGVGVGEKVSANPVAAGQRAVKEAIKKISKEFGKMKKLSNDLIYTPYTAFMIPVKGTEEGVIRGIEEVIGTTPIIGGTSGTDLKVLAPYQIADWKGYRDSVVVTVIASRYKTGIGFTHAYKPTEKCGIVTKCEKRSITEIEGKTALEVFLGWTGVSASDVGPQGFTNPFGTPDPTGTYWLIRHPDTPEPGETSLEIGTDIRIGSLVTLMFGSKEDQINSAILAAKLAKEEAGGEAAAAIIVQCAGIRRHLGEEGTKKLVKALKSELGNIPFIGWNTFGEQAPTRYKSTEHNNLTTAIFAIGKKRY